MGKSTLTITDNRTGKSREVAITDGAIRAMTCASSRASPRISGFSPMTPPS